MADYDDEGPGGLRTFLGEMHGNLLAKAFPQLSSLLHSIDSHFSEEKAVRKASGGESSSSNSSRGSSNLKGLDTVVEAIQDSMDIVHQDIKMTNIILSSSLEEQLKMSRVLDKILMNGGMGGGNGNGSGGGNGGPSLLDDAVGLGGLGALGKLLKGLVPLAGRLTMWGTVASLGGDTNRPDPTKEDYDKADAAYKAYQAKTKLDYEAKQFKFTAINPNSGAGSDLQNAMDPIPGVVTDAERARNSIKKNYQGNDLEAEQRREAERGQSYEILTKINANLEKIKDLTQDEKDANKLKNITGNGTGSQAQLSPNGSTSPDDKASSMDGLKKSFGSADVPVIDEHGNTQMMPQVMAHDYMRTHPGAKLGNGSDSNNPGSSMATPHLGRNQFRPSGPTSSGVGEDSLAAVTQRGESRGNYGIGNYFGNGGLHTTHFDPENTTVGQVMQMQANKQLFAAGAYQMVPDTLKAGVAALNIDLNQKFDKATQNQLYAGYLLRGKRPNIEAYITGKSNDLDGAAKSMAQEWAAIQYHGKGIYDRDGINHSSVPMGDVTAALQKARETYQKTGNFNQAVLGVEQPHSSHSSFGRPDYGFGDSTIAGMNLPGNAKVGRNPRDSLKATEEFLKNNDVKGKHVVMSGVSNDPSEGGLANIQKQAMMLKNAGATVSILGGGSRPDIASWNDKIQKFANENNIGFVPMGATGPDQVHPKSYKNQLQDIENSNVNERNSLPQSPHTLTPSTAFPDINATRKDGKSFPGLRDVGIQAHAREMNQAWNIQAKMQTQQNALAAALHSSSEEDAFRMRQAQSNPPLVNQFNHTGGTPGIDRPQKTKDKEHDHVWPPVAPPNHRLSLLFRQDQYKVGGIGHQ